MYKALDMIPSTSVHPFILFPPQYVRIFKSWENYSSPWVTYDLLSKQWLISTSNVSISPQTSEISTVPDLFSLFFLFLFVFFWDQVSLYILGWPWTYSVAQTGFKFAILLPHSLPSAWNYRPASPRPDQSRNSFFPKLTLFFSFIYWEREHVCTRVPRGLHGD